MHEGLCCLIRYYILRASRVCAVGRPTLGVLSVYKAKTQGGTVLHRTVPAQYHTRPARGGPSAVGAVDGAMARTRMALSASSSGGHATCIRAFLKVVVPRADGDRQSAPVWRAWAEIARRTFYLSDCPCSQALRIG